MQLIHQTFLSLATWVKDTLCIISALQLDICYLYFSDVRLHYDRCSQQCSNPEKPRVSVSCRSEWGSKFTNMSNNNVMWTSFSFTRTGERPVFGTRWPYKASAKLDPGICPSIHPSIHQSIYIIHNNLSFRGLQGGTEVDPSWRWVRVYLGKVASSSKGLWHKCCMQSKFWSLVICMWIEATG